MFSAESFAHDHSAEDRREYLESLLRECKKEEAAPVLGDDALNDLIARKWGPFFLLWFDSQGSNLNFSFYVHGSLENAFVLSNFGLFQKCFLAVFRMLINITYAFGSIFCCPAGTWCLFIMFSVVSVILIIPFIFFSPCSSESEIDVFESVDKQRREEELVILIFSWNISCSYNGWMSCPGFWHKKQ